MLSYLAMNAREAGGDLASSWLSVVGSGKKGSERKNEGGLVLPRFFLARFRLSPTTESLEQAIGDLML